MGVKEYSKIMDYKVRQVKSKEGDKKNWTNETAGWVKDIPLSIAPKKVDIIDIYGVYNRCICEELFYVRIDNKE